MRRSLCLIVSLGPRCGWYLANHSFHIHGISLAIGALWCTFLKEGDKKERLNQPHGIWVILIL